MKEKYVWWFASIVLVGAALYSFFIGYTYGALSNILALIAIGVCAYLLRKLKAPFHMHLLFASLFLAALFLGTTLNFYERFSWWDLFLHSYSGCIMVLIMPYVAKQKSFTLAFLLLAILAANGLGAVWEIYEFMVGVTTIVAANVVDIVHDLIANLLGSIAGASILFFTQRTSTRRLSKG